MALSIFPGSRPPSIVDGAELNFCVRDGNRWTLRPINTNDLLPFPNSVDIIPRFVRMSTSFFAFFRLAFISFIHGSSRSRIKWNKTQRGVTDLGIPMNRLMPGQTAVVGRIDVGAQLQKRLDHLGVIEGTRVRCLRICPLRDPALYQMRGTVLALRGRDAAKIEVLTDRERGEEARL